MADTPEQKEAKKVEKLVAELATFGITKTTGTEAVTPLSGEETSEKLTELLKAAKAEAKAKAKPISIRHRDHLGRPETRTFSKEVHGENYAELAAEFRKTNADKLLPDEETAA